MSEQLEVVRTVDVIAAEINALTATMLSNVIEIGRRMVEAKELLPHGEFGKWLRENTAYSTSKANNYMRLFKEYGSAQNSLFGAEINCHTYGNLNYSKALALLEVPAEERESFVKENDVEAMSTRELQEAIRERDEARRQRDEALQASEGSALAMGELQDKLNETKTKLRETREARDEMAGFLRERTAEVQELEAEVKQLKERPVDVAVQEPDPEAVAKAVNEALAQATQKHQDELAKMQAALDKKVKENNRLEKAVAKAKKAAAEAKSTEEKDRLDAEVKRLTKELAMAAPEITTFKVHFTAWQRTYTQMMEVLKTVPGDAADNLRQAVKAQIQEWGRV